MKHTTEFDAVVVYGARGHTQLILTQFAEVWRDKVRVLALVDDFEHGLMHPTLGLPVVSAGDRVAIFADVPVLVTPGSTVARRAICARLDIEGATLATVVHKGRSMVDDGVTLGAGSLCTLLTRIGPRNVIGAGCQILGDLLSHDVTMGDFCNLGFKATVLGHVVIGHDVNIAPGAIIRNGTRERPVRIGDGAVIGVGAVVLRDVPPGAHMVGNPAMTVDDWARLRRLLKGPKSGETEAL